MEIMTPNFSIRGEIQIIIRAVSKAPCLPRIPSYHTEKNGVLKIDFKTT